MSIIPPDFDTVAEGEMPYSKGDKSAPPRAPRPKDAATLILIRKHASGPRILMGRRASGHSFMPDKYVFPGGKVDRCDAYVSPHDDYLARTAEDLAKHNPRRNPKAFGLAAIRETWEEAGLVIGKPGSLPMGTKDAGWTSYGELRVAPHLSPLHFIARAITPPMRHKRFDARFFMADADEALLDDRPAKDGAEMEDLRWFSYDEALALDLPSVTRFVLGEIAARLKEPQKDHRPPFLRWGRSGHAMDRL